MLSAALRKYRLVISTGYPLSKGLLTPSESSRDYGRTSLYKSHSDFHSTSQLPLHPIIPFFFPLLPTKAAAQYQPVLQLPMLLKSWQLMLSWRAGTKLLPLDLYFPDHDFQVLEVQELGYFFQSFLLVFTVGLVRCRSECMSSMVSPYQDSSTYPKISYAKFPAVVSSFHTVRTERWALIPFLCTSEGQEMPLSHHVP